MGRLCTVSSASGRQLAMRKGVLEDELDRQPGGKELVIDFRVFGSAGERRLGERHGDFYFSIGAVLLKKRGQTLVGGIHVTRGKSAFRAGDIDRAHDDLVHRHRLFSREARSVDTHDEYGSFSERARRRVWIRRVLDERNGDARFAGLGRRRGQGEKVRDPVNLGLTGMPELLPWARTPPKTPILRSPVRWSFSSHPPRSTETTRHHTIPVR